MTVVWNVPETDGGSPITNYTIEKKDVARSSYVKVDQVSADSLKVVANRLVEDKEYVFRVCAENAIGASDWAETEEPTMAKLPFGKKYCSEHT